MRRAMYEVAWTAMDGHGSSSTVMAVTVTDVQLQLDFLYHVCWLAVILPLVPHCDSRLHLGSCFY
jgi:hypothetical protein